jgi:hypothetical protein
MSSLARLGFCAALLIAVPLAEAADWNTAPSYYTHDPNTARRVSQFSPIGPFYVYSPPNYVKSGFRHTRSSVQAGGSADNLHIVEEWGRPVQPYEQWRFGTRPYGDAPYQAWGPPFAGAAIAPGYGGYGGYGGGIGPGGFNGGGGGYSPYYQMQGPAPWLDGYYPSYDSNDRSHYYDPYPQRGGRGGGW